MATQLAENKGVLGLENPMGTDGFEFVEYTAPDPALLRDLFTKMGFPAVAQHKRKDVTLHRQGDINFIINAEHGSYAEQYARTMARAPARWLSGQGREGRVRARGRVSAPQPVTSDVAHGEMDIPVNRRHWRIALVLRRPLWRARARSMRLISTSSPMPSSRLKDLDSRLTYIDHLTHNVHRGPDGFGRTFTSGSSTSAKSATSTSRASRPACSRRR